MVFETCKYMLRGRTYSTCMLLIFLFVVLLAFTLARWFQSRWAMRDASVVSSGLADHSRLMTVLYRDGKMSLSTSSELGLTILFPGVVFYIYTFSEFWLADLHQESPNLIDFGVVSTINVVIIVSAPVSMHYHHITSLSDNHYQPSARHCKCHDIVRFLTSLRRNDKLISSTSQLTAHIAFLPHCACFTQLTSCMQTRDRSFRVYTHFTGVTPVSSPVALRRLSAR